MRRSIRMIGLTVILALVVGCSGVAGPAAPQAPAKEVDQRLVTGNTAFGLGIFHQLRAEKPDENLFISPSSVSLALSMTMGGAAGATQQAMAKALGVDGLSQAEVDRANGALQTVLANPDPKVELAIANSLWYAQSHKVAPAFLETAKRDYKAEAQAVDFAAPSAAKSMNAWVSKATREKITSITGKTDPLDRMYLINAIYFNGKWQNPFDQALTRPRTFTAQGGAKSEIPMMNQAGYFRYLKGENFQAAALPYGEGRLNLYLFVPDPGVTLERFYEALTPKNWQDWMGRFERREGSVTLPKVKLTYQAQLKPALTNLGMGIAFTPQADFSNLFADNREDLFVSSVLHKTFLEIDEKGTEAAAVTAVTVRTTSAAPPTNRFTLVADRPFFIALRDDQTGAVLFLGSITKL